MGMNLDPASFKQFLEGDQVVFDKIYRFYENNLFIRAFSIIQRTAEAEDIAIESITKLFEVRKKLTDAAQIEPLLFAILKNKAIDALRQERLYRKRLGQWANAAEDPAILDFQDEVEKEVIASVLEKIYHEIDSLPEQCKKVVQLYRIEGYSMEAIARLLEISPKTGYAHWHLAKKKILKALEQKGIRLLFLIWWLYDLFF